MTKRDKLIIQYLKHFRVMARDQIAQLACPEVARPVVTVNRILKRLSRDGYVLPIPQVKDRPYLYMPNPAIIHHRSNKIEHFLGLVDIYLRLKKPKIFEVEPQINDEYVPDAYTRINDRPVIIEYQRTLISTKKMQSKVDAFVESYVRKQHDARTLLIVSDHNYPKITIPSGFHIIHKKTS